MCAKSKHLCDPIEDNSIVDFVIENNDEIDFDKFDNLEPIRIGEPRGFASGSNARGDLREFQSLDELGEAARVAGEKFKACFATK